MRIWRFLSLILIAAAAQAQRWDNSGNSLLNGTYYFRHVVYILNGDQYGDLGDAIVLYGQIQFNGNGTYTIAASQNAVILDAQYGYGSLVTSGTYSIAASGYGFISSPINSVYGVNDAICGLVSQGVFVGSSTENVNGYNDMFIAAKLPSPAPSSNSFFTGSWVGAGIDLFGGGGSPAYDLSYQFTFAPDGNGNLGTMAATGYLGGGATLYPQTSTGMKYAISGSALSVTFPSNGALVYGQKFLYFSPDGNFFFGGGPYNSADPYDMIVGVKVGSSAPNVSGLFYEAGLDEATFVSGSSVYGELDTYYGSFNAVAGVAPPCATPLANGCRSILGHQRVHDIFEANTYDYTYNDSFTLLTNSTYSNSLARYAVGDGGAVRIGSGIGPTLGLSVALQAPNPCPLVPSCQSSGGVYVDPTRIQNAASSAAFTTGIAPGETLTLYGTNLGPSPYLQAPIPFPTTGLGGVEVTIGGQPAPVFFVSPTQLSAVVPYGATGSSCPPSTRPCVQIQVTNNGVLSNTVTAFVSATAPGVFTSPQPGGLGYGAIEHLGIGNSVAAPGSVVSAANPAVMGETLAVYLTGLGAVSPTISDGAPGPSGTLSNATAGVLIDFSGLPTAGVTPLFAGLAPALSGLYQINVAVPTGLTPGDNYLGITSLDASSNLQAYMHYLLVPIAAAPATSGATDANATPAAAVPRLRNWGAGLPARGVSGSRLSVGK
jgi:uncharacterized protein (TIGR03437 family)